MTLVTALRRHKVRSCGPSRPRDPSRRSESSSDRHTATITDTGHTWPAASAGPKLNGLDSPASVVISPNVRGEMEHALLELQQVVMAGEVELVSDDGSD